MGNPHCCMRPDKKTENNLEARNLFSSNHNIKNINSDNLKLPKKLENNNFKTSVQSSSLPFINSPENKTNIDNISNNNINFKNNENIHNNNIINDEKKISLNAIMKTNLYQKKKK